MTLTNLEITTFIKKLHTDTLTLDKDLEECLDKKERARVLRRHANLDRCIKVLYLLKSYSDEEN